MIQQKNKLMLWLLGGTIILSLVVQWCHLEFDLFQHSMAHGIREASRPSAWATNLLLVIPIALLAVNYILYRVRSDHPYIPVVNVIALTFASISIIAAGGGGVEFHFSIFMVIAIMAYYESIKLIMISTVIFALQHVLGFFFFPELVFGVASYSFIMLVTHAVFLILTSSATSWQVYSKLKITRRLEGEKELKQEEAARLLETVKTLSAQLDHSSMVVSEKSIGNIHSNQQMLSNFREVSISLESQSQSILNIESNLMTISTQIQQNSASFSELNYMAAITEEALRANRDKITPLFDQIRSASNTIGQTTSAISALNESAQQVERITASISGIANTTSLLALNASIEAARAGEHGKGFSIVASEIRKLADQSNKATIEISEILTAIQSESQHTVARVKDSRNSIDRAVAMTEASIASLAQLHEDVHQMTMIIASLNESVKEIELRSQGIAEEMTNISDVTEMNVSAVQDLLDKTESQVASSKKVNDELIRLSDLSKTLQEKFVR